MSIGFKSVQCNNTIVVFVCELCPVRWEFMCVSWFDDVWVCIHLPAQKKYTSRHGPEETSSRIEEEVGPQEEVGEAPQEVQEAQQQEGCPQASQVPQEEALQEG